MNTQAWALSYASLGWRVFPVVPRGKRPLYRGWQQDATSDPTQIERYWRSEPGPNIGLVCGEAFDAFDIEADYLPTLKAWIDDRGYTLPPTPVARTGRGGVHILVTPLAMGGGRDIYLAGEHIGELKSAGGFIVACPSVTIGQYSWLSGPTDALVTAPAWLASLADRGPRPLRDRAALTRGNLNSGRRVDALAAAVGGAGVGRRNKLLYWAMRRAIEEGDPLRAAGLTLAKAALRVGLSEREIETTIRSAYQASLR